MDQPDINQEGLARVRSVQRPQVVNKLHPGVSETMSGPLRSCEKVMKDFVNNDLSELKRSNEGLSYVGKAGVM
jgi:hypothetical protein